MNINQYDSYFIIILFLISLILYVARSTKGIKRLSRSQRALIFIPNDIKETLIGILLGDGHIVRRSLTGNSRLVYAQSALIHKEYFYHVYNIFSSLCVNDYVPQYKVTKDNRTKKTYTVLIFTTMQLPCFNIFRDIFYLFKTQRVPDNIYELLTPRGLAYWIMDDGSSQGKGLHISVYAFSKDDTDKLMFVLRNKFNLKCSVHYNIDKKPRIYIFKESMGSLISLVSPYFIKEMLYKLGL